MTTALPPELRRYVVEQDYERYDAADQAVWRFVMLHLYEHLKTAAHPSYVEGLRRSALSTDAIPRVDLMDGALSELGWGAVCVDGFVPPRVFQRFQALGVLPIAADIRKPNHVAYTPAPDIIHEAAGHAPVLVDDAYAQYLRRSGLAGELAFSSAEDHDVYEAITTLSRVKELLPDGSPEITAAEQQLERALSEQTETSEAARMARLYWWTAEYGLVGTPHNFKLYGAGLLSSLGEAVYCLDPKVNKVPLDVGCLDVSYDITKPQPQLFVTPSFMHLFDVLEKAMGKLAANSGARASLDAAIRTRLPCQVELTTGDALVGTLLDYGTDLGRPTWLKLETAPNPKDSKAAETTLVPLGMPDKPLSMSQLKAAAEQKREVSFAYAGGARVWGKLVGLKGGAAAPQLLMENASVEVAGTVTRAQRFSLVLGSEVVRALPADDQVGEATVSAAPNAVSRKAPGERRLSASEKELRALFEEATEAWRDRAGTNCIPIFERIHRTLNDRYPREWLLRWNLLESLLKLGEEAEASSLQKELQLLEIEHKGREPIATGLGSLSGLGAASNDSVEEAS